MTFKAKSHAVAFYDALETAKGPSLGTNFTLRLVVAQHLRCNHMLTWSSCPYTLLAHYSELNWVSGIMYPTVPQITDRNRPHSME